MTMGSWCGRGGRAGQSGLGEGGLGLIWAGKEIVKFWRRWEGYTRG